MHADVLLVLITILVALIFDFVNGFHDSANSIATVVSTRVLSPRLAVVWAALFNFLAAFFLGTAVAKTIGSGMIRLEFVDQYVVLAGLFGAIAWDLLTWWWGLPTSSSHALIGGYAGAAMSRAAFRYGVAAMPNVIIPHGWTKTLIFIVVAPMMGLILGFVFMLSVYWIFRRSAPQPVDRLFRRLQLISAAAYSLGHGANDAQKTMGQKITKLKPVGGFCAETAGALTLFGTALAGIPVSTTHTITGAIVGVGAVHRLSAVRWGVAGRIIWAWIFTIPASAVIAGVTYGIMNKLS